MRQTKSCCLLRDEMVGNVMSANDSKLMLLCEFVANSVNKVWVITLIEHTNSIEPQLLIVIYTLLHICMAFIL